MTTATASSTQHSMLASEIERFVRDRLSCTEETPYEVAHPYETPHTVESILEDVFRELFNQKGHPALPDVLPFALKHIPSLAKLAHQQSWITARVCAAVATRPVVTLFELELELCAEAGVASFEAFGLGPCLLCLPMAQHFFDLNVKNQSSVWPIRAGDFLNYLMHLPIAERLLMQGGDVRDVVNGFQTYLHQTRPDLRPVGGAMRSNRALGLHIQDFPALLTSLRQEWAQPRESVLKELALTTEIRLARNQEFYRALIESVDAALSNDVLFFNPHPSKHANNELDVATEGLQVWVQLPEHAARRTSLPLCLWQTPSLEVGNMQNLNNNEDPNSHNFKNRNSSRVAMGPPFPGRGGLALSIYIGGNVSSTSPTLPIPLTTPSAVLASSSSTPSPIVNPTTFPTPRMRGRPRGGFRASAPSTVLDMSPTPVSSDAAASFSIPSSWMGAGGASCPAATGGAAASPLSQPITEPTSFTSNHRANPNNQNNNADATPSILAALTTPFDDPTQRLRALLQLQPGMRLPRSVLQQTWAELHPHLRQAKLNPFDSNLNGDTGASWVQDLASLPFIPIPHPRSDPSFAAFYASHVFPCVPQTEAPKREITKDQEGPPAAASEGEGEEEERWFEILAMARPAELCWFPPTRQDQGDDDDAEDAHADASENDLPDPSSGQIEPPPQTHEKTADFEQEPRARAGKKLSRAPSSHLPPRCPTDRAGLPWAAFFHADLGRWYGDGARRRGRPRPGQHPGRDTESFPPPTPCAVGARDFFNALGVAAEPTPAAWFASMRWNRRLYRADVFAGAGLATSAWRLLAGLVDGAVTRGWEALLQHAACGGAVEGKKTSAGCRQTDPAAAAPPDEDAEPGPFHARCPPSPSPSSSPLPSPSNGKFNSPSPFPPPPPNPDAPSALSLPHAPAPSPAQRCLQQALDDVLRALPPPGELQRTFWCVRHRGWVAAADGGGVVFAVTRRDVGVNGHPRLRPLGWDFPPDVQASPRGTRYSTPTTHPNPTRDKDQRPENTCSRARHGKPGHCSPYPMNNPMWNNPDRPGNPNHASDAPYTVAKVSGTSVSSLRTVRLPAAPSDALTAVLARAGVVVFHTRLQRRVRFAAPRENENPHTGPIAAQRLHHRLARLVPFLQTLLFQMDRSFYRQHYDAIARRLRTLRVVLGREGTLREVFYDLVDPTPIHLDTPPDLNSHPPAHKDDGNGQSDRVLTQSNGFKDFNRCYVAPPRSPLPLFYDAAQGVVYGDAEVENHPAALAAVLGELFFPNEVGPARLRRRFRDAAERLDRAAFAFPSRSDDDPKSSASWRDKEEAKAGAVALTRAAAEIGLTAFPPSLAQREHDFAADRATHHVIQGLQPTQQRSEAFKHHKHGTLDDIGCVPFVVAAPPGVRAMNVFPPGCDGTLAPTRMRRDAATASREAGNAKNASFSDWPHSLYSSSAAKGGLSVLTEARKLAWPDTAEFFSDFAYHPGRRGGIPHEASFAVTAAQKESQPKNYEAESKREKKFADEGLDGKEDEAAQEEDVMIRFRTRAPKRPRTDSNPWDEDKDYFTYNNNNSNNRSGRWIQGRNGDDTPEYAIRAERFVFEWLENELKTSEAKQANGGTCREVVWVNAAGESGLPYDLVLLRRRAQPAVLSNSGMRAFYTTTHTTFKNVDPLDNKMNKDGSKNDRNHNTNNSYDSSEVEAYIEVKSTVSADRTDFELSLREFLFAARFGPAFRVFRVFHACNKARMHFRVYSDLIRLWRTGRLTISGEIHVLPGE